MGKLLTFLNIFSKMPQIEAHITGSQKKPQITFSTKLKISLATLGLVVVLLSLTGFSLWVAFTNQAVVQQVEYSGDINNFFNNAHLALSQEETYEHKYLLAPTSNVITNFNQVATRFKTILSAAQNSGNAADQAVIDNILAAHENYVSAVNKLFADVNADNKVLADKTYQDNIDQNFAKLEELVTQADTYHQSLADTNLAKLDSTQTFIFVATPIVLIIGIALITLFWLFLQNYQRRSIKDKLDNERLQAVNQVISTALEKEKELNDLKSRFISITSHEFRTPLTAILSSVELVENYSQKMTESKKIEVFARIKAAITNMTGLMDDVLLIGKAEAGKLEFNPARLDLTRFCTELVEEVQLSVGDKHIIDFVCCLPNIVGMLDEKLLRHIITNLLSNAVKYSPQGGTVHFELIKQESEVVIQLKDQGIGIPVEDQARLFENFHRAKNVNTIPGTGLGLSIVKQAVDLHGGQITFLSEVGAGTSFMVKIPLEI